MRIQGRWAGEEPFRPHRSLTDKWIASDPGSSKEKHVKLISAVAVILYGALASVQVFAGMPSANFRTVGFHGGGHVGFHGGRAGFHGGHPGFHGGPRFGVFIGPPLFWPWYYPPAYYGPPVVYYNPPPTVIYSSPPLAVTPSASDYYLGSPGNPVAGLPPNNGAPSQVSGQQPPEGQPGDALAQAPSGQVFMYPRQGQDEQQQGRDRDECYHWAMGQIGYDPNKGLLPAQTTNYYRAMGACLDAHGYSVR
jgi:hypothetical protein